MRREFLSAVKCPQGKDFVFAADNASLIISLLLLLSLLREFTDKICITHQLFHFPVDANIINIEFVTCVEIVCMCLQIHIPWWFIRLTKIEQNYLMS